MAPLRNSCFVFECLYVFVIVTQTDRERILEGHIRRAKAQNLHRIGAGSVAQSSFFR